MRVRRKNTIKTSILSNLADFENMTIYIFFKHFFCAWLEEVINIFNNLKFMIEYDIANSINPNHLVKTEIKNLEMFFETGRFVSRARYKHIVNEELYEYYNWLLWGENITQTLFFDILDILLGAYNFDEYEKKIKNSNKLKINVFNEFFQDRLKKGWFLSIRLQALLWLQEYLKELTDNDITQVCHKFQKKILLMI